MDCLMAYLKMKGMQKGLRNLVMVYQQMRDLRMDLLMEKLKDY